MTNLVIFRDRLGAFLSVFIVKFFRKTEMLSYSEKLKFLIIKKVMMTSQFYDESTLYIYIYIY